MNFCLALVSLYSFGQTSNVNNDYLRQTGNPIKVQTLIKGDSILVVDSIYTYRFNDLDSVFQSKTVYTKYDAQGRVLETVLYDFDTASSQFIPHLKWDDSYFENDVIKSHKTFKYNALEDKWYLQKEDQFIDNGEQSLRTDIVYSDDFPSIKISGTRITWNFDENQYLMGHLSESFDSLTQSWVKKVRSTYFRDENNLDTLRLYENFTSDNWMPQSKTKRTFNNSRIYEELNYVNSEFGTWMIEDKIVHTYANDSKTDSISYFNWDSNYEIWYLTNQTIVMKNSEDLPLETLKRSYNFVTEKWTNDDKYTWEYDQGLLVAQRNYNWMDDNWRIIKLSNNYYTPSKNLDSIITNFYFSSAESPDLIYKTIFNYNEDGGIFRYLNISFNISSGWKKELVSYYFNSNIASPNSINDIVYKTLEVYPNPANNYINIDIEDAGQEIKIIDIKGRIVKTLFAKESGKLNIDISELSPSVYFIISESSSAKFIKK